MKNLRGRVLTLLAAIVVASVATQATAQLPPRGLAGSLPIANPGAMPMYANSPVGGAPQGVIMPPPQAMAQFSNAAFTNQMPLAVAPYSNPQAMYNMPGGYAPQGYNPGATMQPNWGVQPASYAAPQPFPSAGGMAVPAGYEAGGYGAGYSGGGCGSCGGYGCDACSGYGAAGFGARFLSRLLPYAEGGACAPRWYDITLDAMYLTRDDAGRNTDFSSDGVLGNTVLSTNDLDFNDELGFRLTGAHQIFAGATAEFTYFGLFNWTADASVERDPANFPPLGVGPGPYADDLYSIVSDFGLINLPNGFDQTDRARRHSISYSSTIDNFELNIRKRYTAPNCRLQYSWLAGVRYIYLLEDFEYFTLGGGGDAAAVPPVPPRGSMDDDVRTRNSLTGFQIGGDGWLNLTPGVNVGADIKAGVYGNYANQSTNVVAILSPTLANPAGQTLNGRESVDGNDVALVADANLYFMWRLGPHWTVRVGYNFLYLDGVALASENFNAGTARDVINGTNTTTPTINDNGKIFYHGGFGGLEWMW